MSFLDFEEVGLVITVSGSAPRIGPITYSIGLQLRTVSLKLNKSALLHARPSDYNKHKVAGKVFQEEILLLLGQVYGTLVSVKCRRPKLRQRLVCTLSAGCNISSMPRIVHVFAGTKTCLFFFLTTPDWTKVA